MATDDVKGTGIAVLGGGAIGAGMAAVFADAGATVALAEPAAAVREGVAARIADFATEMADAGLAKRDPGGTVSVCSGVEELPRTVDLVVEAGPEDAAIKRTLFATARERCGSAVPIVTTSSAITVSTIVEAPEDRRNCLVVHPANPPALIRVVECVPAPETDPATAVRVAAIFRAAGFSPVMLGREVEGFALNRLQSALLREAYRLVEAGVVDVAGADRLVAEGLGPRWALSGPFETADLNTPGGISGHARRMGPAYARIGRQNGETGLPWSDDLVAEVARQRSAIMPEADRSARVRWRRAALVRILKARRAAVEAWQSGRTDDV